MPAQSRHKDFLQKFVTCYIEHALTLSVKGLEVNLFYSTLNDIVADELDIDSDLANYLHHPFHWELINNGGPLDYVQASKPGDLNCIVLQERYHGHVLPELSQTLTDAVLSKYLVFLDGRLCVYKKSNKF
ncbi:hypothetical protein GOV14_00900 [Candidatus Pacearchaeota archaeon]|nr:hypothetical protein [Candidatus Pacearchaeota archaeon]